jgi:glycosyltransferase A (GT-A) superfamily protein (DUF2064 family)
VPPLTPDEAAALNRCFIRDVCASIEAAAAIVAAGPNPRVAGRNTNAADENAHLPSANAAAENAHTCGAGDRASLAANTALTPAAASLDATAATNRDARVVGMIAYTPAGAQAAFDGLVPPSFKFIAQRGEGLTSRLTNVAADLFAAGYASVSLMNSDSPTIPPAFIAAAVNHLADAGSDPLAPAPSPPAVTGADDGRAAALLIPAGDRLSLIGADDGGYCLIGLNRPHPRIFEEISWSTGEVLAQTLQRAAELRLIVLQTPSWYDIDDAASLRRLISELSSEPSSGPSANTSKNVSRSQKSSSTSTIYPFAERATLSQDEQPPKKSRNKRLHNKANFFTPPATCAWLAVALTDGLADRLGLASPIRSAGRSSRDRRTPEV